MKSSSTITGRFVIITDLKSHSTTAFERLIEGLGEALKVTAAAWLVRAEGSAGTIRNALLRALGARDSVLVIDLATARTASHNFNPDLDARVRALVQPNLNGKP